METSNKKTYYILVKKCNCVVEISKINDFDLDQGEYIKKEKLTYDEFISVALGLKLCTHKSQNTNKK